MKMKPLGSSVILKLIEAEEQTKSGLYIPETAKEKPVKGKVIAVGEGRWDEAGTKRIPLDVNVGDTVLVSPFGGHAFKIEDEEFVVFDIAGILAVLEG
jgi:chaperonin GroES